MIGTFVCFAMTASQAGTQTTQMTVTGDFDGDGKSEKAVVRIVPNTERSDFDIAIGKCKMRIQFWEYIDKVRVTDLDKRDRFTEIEVCANGLSDDYASKFIRFDGKKLIDLGTVSGTCKAVGLGVVLSKGWGGFFDSYELYRFDGISHRLKKVKTELVYVGVECTVKRDTILYSDKTGKTVLCTLKPKQRVVIESVSETNNKSWFLIRTPDKLLGWLPGKQIDGDRFDGLLFAD